MIGEFTEFEKSAFTYLRNAGTKMMVPVIAWLLKSDTQNILVDTGIGDPELVRKYHYPIQKPKQQELDYALSVHGVSPEEIDIVIWTHLHWDHCQNATMFQNAQFFVQKREIEYAVNPLPIHLKAYEIGIKGLKPEWMDVIDKVKVVDGDYEIVEGVKVLLHPGHSIGFQSVMVQGKEHQYLIAGDNVPLMANWNEENPLHSIPNGIHVNLSEYYDTFKKIKDTNAFVLPGHDYLVFEKPLYE
jgi:N-acyl homoserine lactone hydrolase